MKKNQLKFYAGCTILSFTLWGCQKVPSEDQASSVKGKSLSTISASIPVDVSLFEPNTMAWPDLVHGYSGVDTRRRHAKLFLALGLAELTKDPAICDWIIQEAAQHDHEVFYFEELFAHFPAAKATIQSTVDPLGTYTGWSFEQVQQEMQYGAYNIKASIYVHAFNGRHDDIKPVVTPGDDFDTDAATGSDKVLGFYIDANNRIGRVNMWEEVSIATGAPIFAIDGRATNIHDLYDHEGPVVPAIPFGPGPIDPNAPPDEANQRIAISKLQIGHRYDNTGHSEVEMAGKLIRTAIYDYAASTGLFRRNFLRENCLSGTTENIRIADVSSSDADNWVVKNVDKFFCWMHDDPNNWGEGEYDHNYVSLPSAPNVPVFQPRKILFYNTYERDASVYTSMKPLSPTNLWGANISLEGEMGNYDEWYQYDPAAGYNSWWYEYGMRLHWSMTAFAPGSAWTRDVWTNPIKGMIGFKTTGYCTY